MRKIGILGGSFNPITKGHISIAEFVLSSKFKFNEIWLLPCYISLYGKKLVSSKDRFNMCKIASQNNKKIKVCDFEIKNKLKLPSAEIIKMLSIKYPDNIFYFVIGEDTAINLPYWDKYEDFLKNVSVAVVPRPRYDFNKNIIESWIPSNNGYPHLYISNDDNKNKLSDISSSKFRENYLLNKDTSKFIDSKVLDYINLHNLYI